jgi:hypothetical protein
MKILKTVYCSITLLTAIQSSGQTLNANWNNDLNRSLQEFMACENSTKANSECVKYVGESLQTVYKVNDFYSTELGRHMMVSEIVDYLVESVQWTRIGHGYEQAALAEAQNTANAKKAVIAVYMNTAGAGHVALILPGDLQRSGSWGLDVPNSVSFLMMEPQRSYVGKGLSYAFAKNHLKDVVIYARKY